MPSLKSLPIAGQQAEALAQPDEHAAPLRPAREWAPKRRRTTRPRRSVLQLRRVRGARHAGRMPQAAGREDPPVYEVAAGGDAGNPLHYATVLADRRPRHSAFW
jgi:hypothetical protein